MYSISRFIEIDAGHRIPQHSSKCKNIHGHRYKIEANCIGLELLGEGSSSDMLIDFSFLKEEMVNVIDKFCDHALILSKSDAFLNFLVPSGYNLFYPIKTISDWVFTQSEYGNIYCILKSPTAEVLAEHWYNRLIDRIRERSEGIASLRSITVWETPNCKATYPSLE